MDQTRAKKAERPTKPKKKRPTKSKTEMPTKSKTERTINDRSEVRMWPEATISDHCWQGFSESPMRRGFVSFLTAGHRTTARFGGSGLGSLTA